MQIENQTKSSTENKTLSAVTTSGCSTHPIIDNMPASNTDGDSTEQPTILGSQRTNPYTLSNMRTAYNNLGYSSLPVNATNLYVRFLPNSPSQLSILDSVMDTQNLELFDAPMNYDIVQEGDYYQDPSIPDTSVTWQYAVVPTDFQPPSGITFQVLTQIHIPADDYTAVETEAERLASIQDSIICSGGSGARVRPYTPDCGPGYHLDFNLRQCVCNCCPAGYQWDGAQCVPIQPPSPASDAQVPAGNITVTDNNLGITPAVRNVRVVAKRWFKIERTYTDNSGHFQFSKRFKNTVKINVKFTNSYCNIRAVRSARYWQALYMVSKTIGVYGSNKTNIQYNFARYNTATSAKGNRYWMAATTNNAVQEHRDYSTQFGFSAAPLSLNIYLSTSGTIFRGLSATPLYGKRFISNLPSSFINTYLTGLLATNVPFPLFAITAAITRARVDIAVNYFFADVAGFTSDWVKANMYHEMSHASHYVQAGNTWYNNFVNAEVNENITFSGGSYAPYGDGSNSYDTPIIALGEAWGYHMGHFLADQRYATLANCQAEQLTFYCPNGINHPHIDVLENFIPTLQSDPFKWIPKGLMLDLVDVGEPIIITNVNDQVTGYSIQQIFAALQPDISSITAYKSRLMQQNPNNTTNNQMNALFISYGY